MRAYFDIHGSLVVEGEDATEWLALKTWADNWTAGTSPLWVSTKVPADRFGNGTIDLRQMFRTPRKTRVGWWVEFDEPNDNDEIPQGFFIDDARAARFHEEHFLPHHLVPVFAETNLPADEE